MSDQSLRIAGSDDDGRKPEQHSMPPHVEKYKEMLFRHNALAEKRRRSAEEDDEKQSIERELYEYPQTLSLEQQEDVKRFVLQVTGGKIISDMTGKTHERCVRTLHWLPRTMKLAADVFPPLCKETARLAFSTVGLTLVGIGHALKETWQAARNVFRQSA